MIKGFYSDSYEMPIPFSNWNNFDKILDLIDDYIELKEQITEKCNYHIKERNAKTVEVLIINYK